MATVIYSPRENITVTLSYKELLDLHALVEMAMDHNPSRILEHREEGIRAINKITQAVYPDKALLSIWSTGPDPDDLHQEEMAARYDPERVVA